MLLCMVEAMEGREVSTTNIKGALPYTNYDKGDIHINLEGEMVILLKEINPNYYKYFIYKDKRGRNYTYEEAKKAIHGNLEASLPFW